MQRPRPDGCRLKHSNLKTLQPEVSQPQTAPETAPDNIQRSLSSSDLADGGS